MDPSVKVKLKKKIRVNQAGRVLKKSELPLKKKSKRAPASEVPIKANEGVGSTASVSASSTGPMEVPLSPSFGEVDFWSDSLLQESPLPKAPARAFYYQKEREKRMTYYVLGVFSFFLGLLLVVYLSVQSQFSSEASENNPTELVGGPVLVEAPAVEPSAAEKLRVPASITISDLSEKLQNLKKQFQTPKAVLENIENIQIPTKWNSRLFVEVMLALQENQNLQSDEFKNAFERWHQMAQAKPFDRGWLAEKIKNGEINEIVPAAMKSVLQEVQASWGTLKYLPFHQLFERWTDIESEIPEGAILSLVHEVDGKNTDRELIVHQGFVIREEGKLKFLHALQAGNVAVHDLKEYLQRQSQSDQNKKATNTWRLVGIHLGSISAAF